MTRRWEVAAPEALHADGLWIVKVQASAPTTRPAPVWVECGCRNRCHCHTHHQGAFAVWRKERETREAEGSSFNLGDAITKAYWNLGEVLK